MSDFEKYDARESVDVTWDTHTHESATERLRKLLDERGIEWDYGMLGAHSTKFCVNDVWVSFVAIRDGLTCATIFTPEQVMAVIGPEIVHCRDCQHAHEMSNGRLACAFRPLMMHETTPLAFCSDGKREEGLASGWTLSALDDMYERVRREWSK